MATYNNKHWLLSHIRNSFISTDDTGMCEIVMLGEDFPRQLHAKHKEQLGGKSDDADFFCYPGLEESDDEEADILSQSFDLQLDMDFGHRRRSDTAQRLEKMDLAKRKAAKIKTITCDDSHPVPLTEEEKAQLFEKKVVKKRERKKVKSLLAELLLKAPSLPQNQFIQYAKFDGTAQISIPTRKFRIFLTMLPEEIRNYPMPVVVIGTATIRELIGLICYKCCIANPLINLKPARNYGLYITEEDGEVDSDFPELDPREPCSKFGFSHLGLVENNNSEIESEFEAITLSDSSEKISIASSKPEVIYQPQLDVQQSEDLARMKGHTSAMEAPLYQSYRLQIITKVRAKIEIQLGISGEKIEIDPVLQKNNKFWMRQKAVSYSMDSIAWCELIENKSTKAVFRLVYSLSHNFVNNSNDMSPSQLQTSASFKHHDFETDPQMAQEIVQKINYILEVRSSISRKEYIASKERRKLQTRKTFNLSSSFSK